MDQRPSFWSDLWRHHWYKVPWNHWIDTGDNCRATGSTHSWEVHRGWWFTRLLTWCQRWWHAVCYWHNWLEEWHLRVPWDKGNGYDWQVIWRVKRRDWGWHGTWYWPVDFSYVFLDRGAYNLIFGDPPDDLRGARQWHFWGNGRPFTGTVLYGSLSVTRSWRILKDAGGNINQRWLGLLLPRPLGSVCYGRSQRHID